MKNMVIGVLLASLLSACARPPVGYLKKQGRADSDVPMSAAGAPAPGASVAVDTLSDQSNGPATSKSTSISESAPAPVSDTISTLTSEALAEEAAAKVVTEEAAAKVVTEEAAAKVATEEAAAKVVTQEAAAKAVTEEAAAKVVTQEAAGKVVAKEAALLAAAHAAEVQNAALEATKAAETQAAADAASAREAANAAAAREAANAAKVAAELDAAKAAAAQAAADAAAAQNAAKSNATRDAAKAAAAREAVAEDSLSDSNSLLAKRAIYYPLDGDVVPEQDKRTVQAHAKYLAGHPNRSVRLEGHADERGSSEYNLALGQRRADGVKKMLLVGGVKEGQIESNSYGEEKPMSSAHDEAAWSQNRRTDLNYNVK